MIFVRFTAVVVVVEVVSGVTKTAPVSVEVALGIAAAANVVNIVVPVLVAVARVSELGLVIPVKDFIAAVVVIDETLSDITVRISSFDKKSFF